MLVSENTCSVIHVHVHVHVHVLACMYIQYTLYMSLLMSQSEKERGEKGKEL